ncbi:uncharacterized protein OCT59_019676 [Rhizophagus irregularis]|uniref:uncharacterized protein n=1 Tax=Rhizophagus irregularis TaxID=588596 RepID=UPI00332F85D6|nr:hypothetical protein OCT59_019676 [Rhizophagus irregularis]
MSERFILTSPPMRMEGVENIGTQQMESQLRCVKCSEDLSLYVSYFEAFLAFHLSYKTRIFNLQIYCAL